MTYYVYALIDPISSEIRYIGRTNNINKRLREHLSKRALSKVNHKTNWIKSILAIDKKPIIKILSEYESQGDCLLGEINTIKYYKENGCKLCNATDGGDGCTGFTHSSETKRKLSGSGNHFYGKHHSDEFKRQQSERCGKVTPEIVLEIRKLYTTNMYTQKDLSKMFYLSEHAILNILKRHTWKHI